MSKLPLVLAFCFSLLATPMFAADSDSTEQKTDNPSTEKPDTRTDQGATKRSSAKPAAKPTSGTGSTTWLSAAGTAGARITSAAAGSTLGLPVAAARIFLICEVEHAKAMPLIGDSSKKGLVWLSRAVVIPSAVFVSFVSAPYYSTVNGWKASCEKPFSKECFGLGKYDDSICTP